MGLDMYLQGEAFYTYDHPNRKAQPFEIAETIYQLGYWRKHPNLHGFIVETFADGVDDCQKIELSTDHLHSIIKAVEEETLPHTDGFFFGASATDPDKYADRYGCTIDEAKAEKEREKQRDLLILRSAIAWLEAEEAGVWKAVTYHASW
jgi:hypothetical protein